jgi:hypothetical protein
MTKTECITLLGNILVLIDIQRGSLSPGTPRRKKLDGYRTLLDEKQLELADLLFDENTAAYKAATDGLTKINDQISSTIKDINKVTETFAALASLVSAIDDLFLLATGVG